MGNTIHEKDPKTETMSEGTTSYSYRQKFGLVLGPVLFVFIYIVPAPSGLSPEGWLTTGIAILMATWWITEALPIFVTALLPLVLLPHLDIMSINDAAPPYANPLIFLFMGGFIIAIAMQSWNLHRRIALNLVNLIGSQPTKIILGFMITCAFLSMWVSNTATSLMMLPIAMSIIQLSGDQVDHTDEQKAFGAALVISIAYACNIGGLGTIIGTPPNALLVAFLAETYNIEIGFNQWMAFGVPLVIISIPIAFLVLTKITFPVHIKELPGGQEIIDGELKKIGSITIPEKRVAVIFSLTAAAWILRPLISEIISGVSDTSIAMTAAIMLFIIPSGKVKGEFLLDWGKMSDLPWGILILFGGGLSLANAIMETGLAEWIGRSVEVLHVLPIVLLLLIIISMLIFLTEITSNTASAAAFLPILASVAVGIGYNPVLFVLPAVLAISCAFMLPVATPPNAIVYGSGFFTVPEMARSGFILNMAMIVVLLGYSLLVIIPQLGLEH
ncbi:MAG: DASS family sodium-coupled anion symporter [Balneolales bacterium]